jgi:hypothetical protein
MDVRAHLLSSFSCAKCPNHRHLRRCLTLLRSCMASQNRVDVCRRGLVVVDAIQAKAECVHDDTALS